MKICFEFSIISKVRTLVPEKMSEGMDPYVYKAGENSIITLEIKGKTTENRDWVYDPLHAKFRTNKAIVIDIENFKTGHQMKEDVSNHDCGFVYRVGEDVEVKNYDRDINEVCAPGIHYFKTKETAESWYLQYGDTKGIRLDDLYREWYDNGRLKKEINYKNGKLDGLYRWWYENGQLEVETTYKDGKVDGLYRWWNRNGRIWESRNYIDGEKIN
jgi:Family of unknown function (DUF5758)/MORN repeat variant